MLRTKAKPKGGVVIDRDSISRVRPEMNTVASDFELERVYGDEARNTACGGCAEERRKQS